MDLLVWFSIRTVFGFSVAAVLGSVGFFAGSMLSSPSFAASFAAALRICGTGIGAGLGGFVGWLRPEDTRPLKVVSFGLSLLGGLAGAWGGYLYGVAAYEGDLFARATHFSAVAGSAVACNAISLLINIYRISRHRRL